MRVLKAIAAGIVAAVLAVVGVVLLEILWMAVTIARLQRSENDFGGGGIGVVFSGFLVPMVPALLGFIAGFWWQIRRPVRA